MTMIVGGALALLHRGAGAASLIGPTRTHRNEHVVLRRKVLDVLPATFLLGGQQIKGRS